SQSGLARFEHSHIKSRREPQPHRKLVQALPVLAPILGGAAHSVHAPKAAKTELGQITQSQVFTHSASRGAFVGSRTLTAVRHRAGGAAQVNSVELLRPFGLAQSKPPILLYGSRCSRARDDT